MDRIDAADLAKLATVEFVPPGELTPAQGGVLLAEAVRPEHKVAWLIGAAVDGYLDLEGGGKQVTLVRLPRRDGPATYLLDSAFAGRDRLTLGTYDQGFGAAWRSLGRELGAWERASGLWEEAGDRRRSRARSWGPWPGGRAARGRPGRRLGGPVRARLAGPGGGRRAAGRGGRGRGRARLGAAGPHPGGVGPVAADRVVPAVPGRLRGPPCRGGGQAGVPARVHRLGGRGGRAGPVVAAVAGSSTARADPAAARYPLLAPALVSGTSASSARPSSSGSGGGGGGGVGGGAGGGGGGSW